MLEPTPYKYLNFVKFPELYNWSVQYLHESKIQFNKKYPLVRIGEFLTRNKTAVIIEDDQTYKRATIKVRNGGVSLRDEEIGINIGTKNQFLISEGQFLLSKIDARNGAFGVVPEELNGGIITSNFWTFDVDYTKVNPHYLTLLTTTDSFIAFCEQASNGTTNRHYLQEPLFLNIKVPLPTLDEQNRLVAEYVQSEYAATDLFAKILEETRESGHQLLEKLGISPRRKKSDEIYKMAFIDFSKLRDWCVDRATQQDGYQSTKYKTATLSDMVLCADIFRGKNPRYESSDSYIINQKCVRWHEIDMSFAKPVNSEWLQRVDGDSFTKEGDILINSTGEGTLGRAAVVRGEAIGKMYDSHVLLIRLNKFLINPDFLAAVFNSEYGQEQVNNVKSAQSTKQTELGIGNLKKIIFPLPPMNIQNAIVADIVRSRRQNEERRILRNSILSNALTNFETQIFE